MKNVKQFDEFLTEAYEEHKHKYIKDIRTATNTEAYHKAAKVMSVIDDLKRLDFKALKHSLKNKSGFKKLELIIRELELLKKLKKDDDTLSFQDLYRYEFDSELILKYLNDDDVMDYIEHDLNTKNNIEELDELVSFIEEYDEWKSALKKGMR